MTDPAGALANADALAREASRNNRNGAGDVGVAAAFWMQAAALNGVNRPAQAVAAAQHALNILDRELPGSPLRGETLLARGEALRSLGRIQDGLSDFQAAFAVFRQAREPRGQAVALLHIADIYGDARDFRANIKYLKDAIEIYSKEDILLLALNNNIGNAYSQLYGYKDAEARFKVADEIAVRLRSPLLRVRILTNLAEAQIKGGKLPAAERTLQLAYSLARSDPARTWRPALDSAEAEIAYKLGDLPRARALIESYFAAPDRSAVAPVLRDAHQNAYQILKDSGETTQALAHLEQFKELDDKSRALAASANAALMSARFDFANQDLKIAHLRQAQAEREAVLARTRVRFHTIITAVLLAVAALITTLLAIGFFSIRRSRNEVRAANATLQGTNRQLKRALAAKTEFLATTSHEIRTPLNGILGMTQVLLADRAIDRELKTRVELIHGAGETMRALVDDILDMAKMEKGELRIHPAEMDLHRLLRDAGTVWAGQAQTKGLALAVEPDEAPRGIVADEVRLRQIVFNLMSNAIKFTDRGAVRLVARAEPRDGGEALVIRIEDSGIGIPADRLADIFESFRQVDGGVTRRHGGTGLGLAICRNLARAMGGDVTVESVLGTGSTFILDLPLVRAELPAAAPAEGRGAVASLAEAELLLVEPNPLSQGILRALLAPVVGALHVASDLDAADAALATGGVDHVVADAMAFALDPARATLFAQGAPGMRLTLLWPAPDEAVLAAFEGSESVELVAKPVSAADLLARLRMGYAASAVERDLAA